MAVIDDLKNMKETLWINDDKAADVDTAIKQCELKLEDILEASERLNRFAPYIMKVFPETKEAGGIIESPIVKTDSFAKYIGAQNVYFKLDSNLPISGSIKARGGIYEVLKHAEDIAAQEGVLPDSYEQFADEKYRQLFSRYSIAVGSTGNLGLSIGIMASKMGFKVTVHMSADAREWKKQKLRECGCEVREYEQDYSIAEKHGREEASHDKMCYFIDDENSVNLFMGYSVAALRLEKQLIENKIIVDNEHPLYVYLPCGVVGGPGGVAFGLKQIYKQNVHLYFAEPTHSPCMTLGMATGKNSDICVNDIGLDNKTAADGLAVGRASGFVGKIMKPFIDGCYTVSDDNLFNYLVKAYKLEGLKLEPSALAGCKGAELMKNADNATHIIWATGGGMVPKNIMDEYLKHR